MGQEYSDETAQKIDSEIRRVVDEAYQMADTILTEHREELDKLSQLLIEKETIDREEFEALLAGEDPEEVFKARDEARAKKAAESKRLQRQKRPREDDERAEGIGQVAPSGVSHMTSHGRDRSCVSRIPRLTMQSKLSWHSSSKPVKKQLARR